MNSANGAQADHTGKQRTDFARGYCLLLGRLAPTCCSTPYTQGNTFQRPNADGLPTARVDNGPEAFVGNITRFRMVDRRHAAARWCQAATPASNLASAILLEPLHQRHVHQPKRPRHQLITLRLSSRCGKRWLRHWCTRYYSYRLQHFLTPSLKSAQLGTADYGTRVTRGCSMLATAPADIAATAAETPPGPVIGNHEDRRTRRPVGNNTVAAGTLLLSENQNQSRHRSQSMDAAANADVPTKSGACSRRRRRSRRRPLEKLRAIPYR